MTAFALTSILLTVAALLAFINRRFIGLPSTIGVMAMALVASLIMVGVGAASPHFIEVVRQLLEDINFSDALLEVMLAFLLFAGALHVKLEDLAGQKWIIGVLATVGVAISTVAVGALTKLFFVATGYPMSWLNCFLFGALIAPTDPIAVLGILKSAGVKRSLQTKVTGESLFNDGVGVVIFVALLGFATVEHETTAGEIGLLFAKEVVGALGLGVAFGVFTYWLMRQVDDYLVEVLLSLALCAGVYNLAGALHSSGPLAVVVAGLLVGNQGRQNAMSSLTVQRLDDFWELCDELLNVLLFVLIGLEVLIIPWSPVRLAFGLVAIPMTLLVRFLAVGGTVKVMSLKGQFDPGTVRILTWGGLRGGISIALALILRDRVGNDADILLTATYVVVVFSIVVQGLTVGRLAARVDRQQKELEASGSA